MARAKANPFAENAENSVEESAAEAEPSSTESTKLLEPRGAVEGDRGYLSWARPPGSENEGEAATPAQMPDLNTPEAVLAYLKDHPSVLWQMSKSEIIALIAGADVAAKHAAGEPPPETVTA
jgi:hypothetical protein